MPVKGLEPPTGFVANFEVGPAKPPKTLTYAASEANWANGQSPGENWPLRIMFATSIPSSVADAETKDLNPSIGRTRFLIVRWSCSIMLLRGFVANFGF